MQIVYVFWSEVTWNIDLFLIYSEAGLQILE
jgi:hypothetical protein